METPMRTFSLLCCLLIAAAVPAKAAKLSDTAPPQVSGVDCEDAAQAAAFASGFETRMKSMTDAMKARELAAQQAYEALKKRIVAAGIWDEQSANTFMLQFAVNDAETAAHQARRDAAAKETKTLMYSIAGLPMVAAGDQAAQRRGLCILGQKALVQLAIVSDSSTAAWARVNARVAQFGKEKGVQGL